MAAPKFSLLDLGLALALGLALTLGGTLDMDMDLDPELPLDAFSGPWLGLGWSSPGLTWILDGF